MPIDPQTLEAIRNPLAGLGGIGQAYMAGQKMKQESEALNEQKKLTQLKTQIANMDLATTERKALYDESKIRAGISEQILTDIQSNPQLSEPDAFSQYMTSVTEDLPENISGKLKTATPEQIPNILRRNKRMVEVLAPEDQRKPWKSGMVYKDGKPVHSAFMDTVGDMHVQLGEGKTRKLEKDEVFSSTEISATDPGFMKGPEAKILEKEMTTINETYDIALKSEPTIDRLVETVSLPDFNSGRVQAFLRPLSEISQDLGGPPLNSSADLATVNQSLQRLILDNAGLMKGNLNQSEFSSLKQSVGDESNSEKQLQIIAYSAQEINRRQKERKMMADQWLSPEGQNKRDLKGFAKHWEKYTESRPVSRLRKNKDGSINRQFFTRIEQKVITRFGQGSDEHKMFLQDWANDKQWYKP
jgi:hypothetical protein